MSETPALLPPPPTAAPASLVSRRSRLLQSVAAIALALAALAQWALARRSFAPVEATVARYDFGGRRPDEVAALRREPAADLAAAMLAEMALEDATAPVSLAGLSPARQRAWIESVADRAQALRDAQGLLLSALRARPGWPYLRYLLVRTELAGAGSGAREAPDRLWATLRSAAAALPGLDGPWVALAEVALDRWPRLSEAERDLARRALRRAFEDEEFVRAGLPAAMTALGREDALRLLPEEPGPLQAALEDFAQQRDAAAYAALDGRWRDAARRARARQLAAIEQRARTGELSALADACRVWAETHRPWSLDDPDALRQALRVLELWPRFATGFWESDHRGELIRFFLNGREEAARGPALANGMAPLSGVPDPIRAQVYLVSGDDYEFDAIVRSSPSVGSFEWTPVFTRLAQREVQAGRLGAAREALSRVPAAARDACEVLLARRALARASGDRIELDNVDLRLAAESIEEYDPDAWSPSRTLLLCADPETRGSRALRVGLLASVPAYVEWGWNGSRAGGTLVRAGSGTLTLPLEGRFGRVSLHLRDRVGGPTRVDRTSLAQGR